MVEGNIWGGFLLFVGRKVPLALSPCSPMPSLLFLGFALSVTLRHQLGSGEREGGVERRITEDSGRGEGECGGEDDLASDGRQATQVSSGRGQDKGRQPARHISAREREHKRRSIVGTSEAGVA